LQQFAFQPVRMESRVHFGMDVGRPLVWPACLQTAKEKLVSSQENDFSVARDD
jgi:hypothetical protein